MWNFVIFFFHGAYPFNSSIQRVGRNQKNDTNSARDSLCMNINQVSSQRLNVNGSSTGEGRPSITNFSGLDVGTNFQT